MPRSPAERPAEAERLAESARAAQPLRLGWVLLTLGLLVAEALALSYLYDVRQLLELGTWWSGLGHVGTWLPLGFVAIAGALTAVGPRLLSTSEGRELGPTLGWIALGSAGFAASLGATEWLMTTEAPSGLALGAWCLTTGAWLVLRALGVMPLSSFGRAAREHGRRGLAGAVIGAVAFGVAWALQDGWGSLAPWTLHGATALLRLAGSEPWVEGASTLGLGEFAVEIAPVCSGVEGMGLMAILIVGFIVVRRRELDLWRALWLLPLGVVGAFALNLVRIAVLVAIGASGHPEVAIGGFHSKAGWVFFTLLAIALLRLLELDAFRKRRRAEHDAVDRGPTTFTSPAAPRLLPLLVLTLVGLATESTAASVDHLYVARAAVGLGVLLWAAPELPELEKPSLEAVGTAIAVGAASFLLWWLLVPFDPERSSAVALEFEALPSWRFQVELALRALGGVVVVPLAEELAFRSYLQRRIGHAEFDAAPFRDASPLAIAATSIVFGALHGQAWLPAILVGFAYGIAQRLANSFVVAAIGHGVTNLGVWLSVAFFGRLDWF